jgi:5'-nucleotidase
MYILVSNDDGVYAPGIQMLYQSILPFANPVVVAPDRDRSAASHSLTLKQPMRAHTLSNGFIMVDGTPADCVYLALRGLLPQEPKMVVSGINSGANLGDDVIYSGTVAAAVEARHLGMPSIAFSLGGDCNHFATAGKVAAQLIQHIIRYPAPDDLILNVNIPDIPYEQIKGFQVCRLGKRHPARGLVSSNDPRGKTIYWIGDIGDENDAGPGTDFHAIREGYVSITPLNVDLTKNSLMNDVKHWAESI